MMYGLGQGILHEQAAKETAYRECVALNQGNCVPPTPLPQLLPTLTTTATPFPWLAVGLLGAFFLLGGRK